MTAKMSAELSLEEMEQIVDEHRQIEFWRARSELEQEKRELRAPGTGGARFAAPASSRRRPARGRRLFIVRLGCGVSAGRWRSSKLKSAMRLPVKCNRRIRLGSSVQGYGLSKSPGRVYFACGFCNCLPNEESSSLGHRCRRDWP